MLVGVGVAETEPQSACAPDEGPDEHDAAPAPRKVTSATPTRMRRFRQVIRTRAASHIHWQSVQTTNLLAIRTVQSVSLSPGSVIRDTPG